MALLLRDREAANGAATPPPNVPAGFRCELVLEAPDLEAPTALAVASNGDVYVAEDPMDMAGPPTQNPPTVSGPWFRLPLKGMLTIEIRTTPSPKAGNGECDGECPLK